MLVKFFQTGCCKTHFVRGVPSEWGGGGGGGGGGATSYKDFIGPSTYHNISE